MGKLTYCYWPVRGLGEPARMLLAYGEIDHEYKVAGPEWFENKFKMGFDFPNLPYVIDGDVKVTESWAIYKYLAGKIGLVPCTDKEKLDSNVIESVIQEVRSNFTTSCYKPEFYSLVDKLLERQSGKIAQFENFLEKKNFLLGDKLSYLDFALYETFDHHRLFFIDIFDKSPNIQAFMKRFESFEKISAYLKSDSYKKFPINGGSASWGGQNENDKK